MTEGQRSTPLPSPSEYQEYERQIENAARRILEQTAPLQRRAAWQTVLSVISTILVATALFWTITDSVTENRTAIESNRAENKEDVARLLVAIERSRAENKEDVSDLRVAIAESNFESQSRIGSLENQLNSERQELNGLIQSYVAELQTSAFNQIIANRESIIELKHAYSSIDPQKINELLRREGLL